MTYQELVQEIYAVNPQAETSQMFGMPIVKNDQNKAAFGDYNGDAVFKLNDEERINEVLKLDGAHLFDPMGGRPMKQWVVVPAVHSEQWLALAQEALQD